jgi:uncharacterized DUF497 family protein
MADSDDAELVRGDRPCVFDLRCFRRFSIRRSLAREAALESAGTTYFHGLESGYDWVERNEGHVAAHRVESTEVEEVLANDPIRIESRTDPRSREERVLELGHTNADRISFVARTPRGKHERPVTAFDANRKTRAAYRRRRNGGEQQQHN